MSNSDKETTKIENETFYLFLLIIVLLVAVISCSISCYNTFISEPDPKNTILAYNNIINKFRYDTRFAVSAVIATDSLSLLDNNSNQICKYELKDNNILRTDKNNNISTIFKKVESISFTLSKNLPNLVTVRIYPADKQEIPFFTSFALRGLEKNE